ncbi:MAG: glutathione S-transferase [Kordiimonadaceae bacterium]|nr:glutathione S-transferase [Kordiimonadaceae bacterium]MBO6569058.1 glutathione S-transferase [Kordiimonadaceae bacterium]MBO6964533.1 glutathione S-transferase [Kordiimonadaceae bacterium]
MITLYRHPLSGHAHRVELMLSLLKLDYNLIDIDLLKGEQKQPSFTAKNPFGQVPVLEDGDVTLWDSNAILIYLARTYGNGAWLPLDPVEEAKVTPWLSIAAGKIAFGPAAARLVTVFGAGLDHEVAKSTAYALFDVMEKVLGNSQFLAGDNATIADVAGYSYIAHAPEGDVSLADYPNVRAWLARIEALVGFVPMQETKAGLRAA